MTHPSTPASQKSAPSVESVMARIKRGLDFGWAQTCMHEETHRGGAIWEICDLCGAKWADDKGGKPAYEHPPELDDAENALAELRERLAVQPEPRQAQAATNCWNCNAPYPIGDKCCPVCNATNANLDFEQAKDELKAKDAAPSGEVSSSRAPLAANDDYLTELIKRYTHTDPEAHPVRFAEYMDLVRNVLENCTQGSALPAAPTPLSISDSNLMLLIDNAVHRSSKSYTKEVRREIIAEIAALALPGAATADPTRELFSVKYERLLREAGPISPEASALMTELYEDGAITPPGAGVPAGPTDYPPLPRKIERLNRLFGYTEAEMDAHVDADRIARGSTYDALLALVDSFGDARHSEGVYSDDYHRRGKHYRDEARQRRVAIVDVLANRAARGIAPTHTPPLEGYAPGLSFDQQYGVYRWDGHCQGLDLNQTQAVLHALDRAANGSRGIAAVPSDKPRSADEQRLDAFVLSSGRASVEEIAATDAPEVDAAPLLKALNMQRAEARLRVLFSNYRLESPSRLERCWQDQREELFSILAAPVPVAAALPSTDARKCDCSQGLVHCNCYRSVLKERAGSGDAPTPGGKS